MMDASQRSTSPRRLPPVVIAILVAGVVIAAARPALRTKSFAASPAGSAIVQASGQWIPFADVPFLVTGVAATAPPSYDTYNSGRVSAIAVDPRDSSRWLLGFGNSGVWETRDSGQTWNPLTDNAPTLAIGDIAFAPSNPDIVYVGTGENGVFTNLTHVGVGLLKSTNNGTDWSLVGQSSLAQASILAVRVDPKDPNVLLVAATRAGAGRDGGNGSPIPRSYGVMRSTDGGISWTRTLNGVASALEVDPTNFSRQYAAIAVGNQPNGVFRSTNAGVTWSPINGPWWANPADLNASNGRIELAVAPSNPDVVYASFSVPVSSPDRGNLLGLYRTDNAWADNPTWVRVSTQATGPGGYCSDPPTEQKCEYSHVISVDPRDANRLFGAGARQVWLCTNCGESPSWRNVTSDSRRVFVHVDYHAMAWAGNRLLVGSDGGLFSTSDLGASWASHNRTLTTNMFYMGALHPTEPGSLLGGARDFGTVAYRPNLGWRTMAPVSGDSNGEGDVILSSSRPNTDWGSTSLRLQISRTTDGGRTFIQATGGIDRTSAAGQQPLRKCPTNDDVVLAGSNRIWRSSNFFSAASPSFTAQTPPRQFPTPGFEAATDPAVIISIAFSPDDRNCATYAYGNRGGEVWMTRDGGTTWIDLDPSKSLPARTIGGIAFDPSNANRLFVAVSSYDVATPTKPGHIFRTDNAMSSAPTWTRVGPPDQPFADMPFNVIAIDPRNTQLVYAGSDNGLWQSEDGGTTWARVGLAQGLPPASIYDIQINPATNKTVIFTYGRGAFELAK